MKKYPTFLAYILIGVGLYFVLKQYNLPFFSYFDTWPTLIIIVGLSFIIHGVSKNDHQHLFTGTIVLGLGIHFHGRLHYTGWIDHWAVYVLIIGIAFTVRYLKTKKGLGLGLLLIALSTIIIFSISLPDWLQWVYPLIEQVESFWPFILIAIGVYILMKRR